MDLWEKTSAHLIVIFSIREFQLLSYSSWFSLSCSPFVVIQNNRMKAFTDNIWCLLVSVKFYMISIKEQKGISAFQQEWVLYCKFSLIFSYVAHFSVECIFAEVSAYRMVGSAYRRTKGCFLIKIPLKQLLMLLYSYVFLFPI